VNNANEEPVDIWGRLDDLDDAELAMLVEAAASVIADNTNEAGARIYLEMPPRPAGQILKSTLADAGVAVDDEEAAELVRDEVVTRQLAVHVLRSLAQQPVIAAEIEVAYRARQRMLVIDAGVISAAALLLLVLKLKRVKIGGVDVSFYDARQSALDSIRRMLGM